MPGIARRMVDVAARTELGFRQGSVYANEKLVTVKGDTVASHGKGKHRKPVMVGASGDVFAEGIQVCRAGDLASCGHPSTGSSDVFVN